MILFNDLKSQYRELKPEIEQAVHRVLESGWYVLGKELEAFENAFAAYNDVRYCVGVASGTEAIALALMASGIGKGDEVITSNMTAFPTITGIVQSGATPVVIDIKKEDGLMDPRKVEEKITNRTKAIMPVHLYGQCCDMDIILNLAEIYKLQVIEDCAQSTGAEYQGKKSGSMGHCGAFSFYPTKNLGAYGDGGSVITDDEETFQRLLKMRNYGQSKKYYHDSEGLNSRLDEIQAAILHLKLDKLDKANKKRKTIAAQYQIGLKYVSFLKEQDYGNAVYHLFVVKTASRNSFQEYLLENGVQTMIHYPVPISTQKAFHGQKNEHFPVTEQFASDIISLPLYPGISEETIGKVIDIVNAYKE